MSEQPDLQTPEQPKKPPFQFGMKALFALPIGVALFFSIATYTGIVAAGLISLTVLAAIGMFFRPTRSVSAIVLIVFATRLLLVLAHAPSRAAIWRSQCCYNLRHIALALHSYHDVYGSFPPAYIADEDGQPMHSWRVLILPYLELNDIDLYGRYDFDEPWDGPNNRKLAEIDIGFFSCPADSNTSATMTNYLVVVGPDTVWPGTQQTCLEDLSDGPAQTLLLVEVVNSGIHWMEPRDLHVAQMAPRINPTAGQGISSAHDGIVIVSFADGHQRMIPETVSPEELRAMLTRSGGESVDSESF